MIDLILTPRDVELLLSKRIRAARKRRGWTQEQLAERAALGVATIARIEKDGRGQLSTLFQISAALGHLRDFEALLKEPEPRTLEELRARRGSR